MGAELHVGVHGAQAILIEGRVGHQAAAGGGGGGGGRRGLGRSPQQTHQVWEIEPPRGQVGGELAPPVHPIRSQGALQVAGANGAMQLGEAVARIAPLKVRRQVVGRRAGEGQAGQVIQPRQVRAADGHAAA